MYFRTRYKNSDKLLHNQIILISRGAITIILLENGESSLPINLTNQPLFVVSTISKYDKDVCCVILYKFFEVHWGFFGGLLRLHWSEKTHQFQENQGYNHCPMDWLIFLQTGELSRIFSIEKHITTALAVSAQHAR